MDFPDPTPEWQRQSLTRMTALPRALLLNAVGVANEKSANDFPQKISFLTALAYGVP